MLLCARGNAERPLAIKGATPELVTCAFGGGSRACPRVEFILLWVKIAWMFHLRLLGGTGLDVGGAMGVRHFFLVKLAAFVFWLKIGNNERSSAKLVV